MAAAAEPDVVAWVMDTLMTFNTPVPPRSRELLYWPVDVAPVANVLKRFEVRRGVKHSVDLHFHEKDAAASFCKRLPPKLFYTTPIGLGRQVYLQVNELNVVAFLMWSVLDALDKIAAPKLSVRSQHLLVKEYVDVLAYMPDNKGVSIRLRDSCEYADQLLDDLHDLATAKGISVLLDKRALTLFFILGPK